MFKRSLVTIEDLSNEQIEDILDLAQEIQDDMGAFHGVAVRNIMASLFLEPSTRTRGSFEAAMKRLGGATITTADSSSSSMSKGESLADTIRVWSGYSDMIVMRHPWEGAARLAAEYSDVPVINAGDGSHEHPTQTLLDLYTLRKEFGTLEGLSIVMCGDLKNGRTVHSLIFALSRFGAEIIFLSADGMELPDHVRHKVESIYGRIFEKRSAGYLEALYGNGTNRNAQGLPVHAIYMTPSQPHMRALYEDESELLIRIRPGRPVAIYQTRLQREREAHNGNEDVGPKNYPKVTPRSLSDRRFKRSIVLHPLPRVDELSPAMDSDPRSKYFEQARNGVPVRMALIALMLGLRPWKRIHRELEPTGDPWLPGSSQRYMRCTNPVCVTQKEPQNTNPSFAFYNKPVPRFVCSYCEREALPSYCAYPNGEVYYPIDQVPLNSLDAIEYSFFLDEAAAQASHLRPHKRGWLDYRKGKHG